MATQKRNKGNRTCKRLKVSLTNAEVYRVYETRLCNINKKNNKTIGVHVIENAMQCKHYYKNVLMKWSCLCSACPSPSVIQMIHLTFKVKEKCKKKTLQMVTLESHEVPQWHKAITKKTRTTNYLSLR